MQANKKTVKTIPLSVAVLLVGVVSALTLVAGYKMGRMDGENTEQMRHAFGDMFRWMGQQQGSSMQKQASSDRAAMHGDCENDAVKTLPSGAPAKCVDGKWGKPMQFGLEGADGSIRQVPPFCGPLAHPIDHPKHGQLCVQNEGSWRTASAAGKAENPATRARVGTDVGTWQQTGRESPCLLPNGSNQCANGGLVMCYRMNGNIVYSCG